MAINPKVSSKVNPPAVILTRPQMSLNIGTTARAMKNCALMDLRVVAPKQPPLEDKALKAAAGGEDVLQAVQQFDTLEEAVGDFQAVYATTARQRDLDKPVLSPEECIAAICEHGAAGRRTALVFGPERAGLTAQDLTVADALVSIDLNPDYTSLNLAQGVLVLGYLWYQVAKDVENLPTSKPSSSPPAEKAELMAFFETLESTLTATGVYDIEGRRTRLFQHLRHMFQRSEMTSDEVRMMHGVVRALSGLKRRG